MNTSNWRRRTRFLKASYEQVTQIRMMYARGLGWLSIFSSLAHIRARISWNTSSTSSGSRMIRQIIPIICFSIGLINLWYSLSASCIFRFQSKLKRDQWIIPLIIITSHPIKTCKKIFNRDGYDFSIRKNSRWRHLKLKIPIWIIPALQSIYLQRICKDYRPLKPVISKCPIRETAVSISAMIGKNWKAQKLSNGGSRKFSDLRIHRNSPQYIGFTFPFVSSKS